MGGDSAQPISLTPASREPTIRERLEYFERQQAQAKPRRIPPRKPHKSTAKRRGEFGNVDEGDYKSLIARRIALRVAPSVVSLSSFVGDEYLFACSGIVIEWADSVGTILTSATLLTGHLDTVLDDLTIKVHLCNGEKMSGTIAHYDLHHNIAIITIPCVSKLQSVTLQPDVKAFFPGQIVVAIGRDYKLNGLMASYGEIKFIDYQYESEDLLYSSCSISEYGIGGPLVDFPSGSLIGMDFTDGKGTAFLPSTILLRCLRHFKTYGRVCRPWLGMRTRDIDTLKLAELEKMHHNFHDIHGVYVEKVVKGSPAESAGICPGDIVTHCDGFSVHSHLQLVELLFDKAEKIMEQQSHETSENALKRQAISVEVVITMANSSSSESRSIIIDRLSPPVNDRWLLDRPQDLKRKYYH